MRHRSGIRLQPLTLSFSSRTMRPADLFPIPGTAVNLSMSPSRMADTKSPRLMWTGRSGPASVRCLKYRLIK